MTHDYTQPQHMTSSWKFVLRSSRTWLLLLPKYVTVDNKQATLMAHGNEHMSCAQNVGCYDAADWVKQILNKLLLAYCDGSHTTPAQSPTLQCKFGGISFGFVPLESKRKHLVIKHTSLTRATKFSTYGKWSHSHILAIVKGNRSQKHTINSCLTRTIRRKIWTHFAFFELASY